MLNIGTLQKEGGDAVGRSGESKTTHEAFYFNKFVFLGPGRIVLFV